LLGAHASILPEATNIYFSTIATTP
jgi:hypothetical protein